LKRLVEEPGKFSKNLSCCCDSRSYCLRRTVYWQTIKPVFVTSWRTCNERSDSTGTVYERIQTQSTQAWL